MRTRMRMRMVLQLVTTGKHRIRIRIRSYLQSSKSTSKVKDHHHPTPLTLQSRKKTPSSTSPPPPTMTMTMTTTQQHHHHPHQKKIQSDQAAKIIGSIAKPISTGDWSKLPRRNADRPDPADNPIFQKFRKFGTVSLPKSTTIGPPRERVTTGGGVAVTVWYRKTGVSVR